MKHLPPIPFYFIRHGETAWNYEQKIMGQTDIPLNSFGIKQAHQAAQHLQHLGLERLISSPLRRAKQTADILGSYLDLAPVTNINLSEIFWGDWEGKTADEGWNFKKWTEGYAPPRAESCDDFQKRIKQAFAKILTVNMKTLVVAHNGVYWALTNAVGYPFHKAENCVPYFFHPSEDPDSPWRVQSLGG